MNNIFLTLLPSAIAFMLSPAALIEMILVLFSQRRVVNALSFIGAMLVSGAVVIAVGVLGGEAAADKAGPSTVVAWVLIGLGALLAFMGVKNWRNRRDESEPAIFAKVTAMGPVPVAILAVGAVALNPKNAVLFLAAGQAISATSRPWLIGMVFLLVSLLPYLLAVGYSLLGGYRAEVRLQGAKGWLVRHNRLIMGIVLLLIGLLLIGKGAAALT